MPNKISVIIPTYNHREYVIDSIESALNQTITPYEVIVINDGSTDDTRERLAPYADKQLIQYIEQPNSGQASARNVGLARAKGDLIAFLDDDDIWPLDKLAWQDRLISEDPKIGLVYGYATNLNTGALHSPPISCAPVGNVSEQFMHGTWISSPGQTLIKAEALKSVGEFDRTLKGTDDWDLYIRLAKDWEFLFADREALRYRIHPTNASKNWWSMNRNSLKVVRKHYPLKFDRASIRRWRNSRNSIASICSSSLISIARNERPSRQISLCLASILVYPLSAFKRSHWKSIIKLLSS